MMRRRLSIAVSLLLTVSAGGGLHGQMRVRGVAANVANRVTLTIDSPQRGDATIELVDSALREPCATLMKRFQDELVQQLDDKTQDLVFELAEVPVPASVLYRAVFRRTGATRFSLFPGSPEFEVKRKPTSYVCPREPVAAEAADWTQETEPEVQKSV